MEKKLTLTQIKVRERQLRVQNYQRVGLTQEEIAKTENVCVKTIKRDFKAISAGIRDSELTERMQKNAADYFFMLDETARRHFADFIRRTLPQLDPDTGEESPGEVALAYNEWNAMLRSIELVHKLNPDAFLSLSDELEKFRNVFPDGTSEIAKKSRTDFQKRPSR